MQDKEDKKTYKILQQIKTKDSTHESWHTTLTLICGASCLSVGRPFHVVIIEDCVSPDLVRCNHQLECVGLRGGGRERCGNGMKEVMKVGSELIMWICERGGIWRGRK